MAGEPAGRIPFLGLTGAIAAGKSEALAALERSGAATLSSDAVVHELLGSDELRDLLVERFGAEVAPDGEVDRAAVAAVVFDNPEERSWLEQTLWPRVGERIASWYAGLEDVPAAVVEVPLLFESGMEKVFDATIAVVADDDVRRQRAGERDHAGLADREARQLGQEEKSQRADYVLRNDGDLDELAANASNLLATIGA